LIPQHKDSMPKIKVVTRVMFLRHLRLSDHVGQKSTLDTTRYLSHPHREPLRRKEVVISKEICSLIRSLKTCCTAHYSLDYLRRKSYDNRDVEGRGQGQARNIESQIIFQCCIRCELPCSLKILQSSTDDTKISKGLAFLYFCQRFVPFKSKSKTFHLS
jgi:hypothetical protein